MKSHDDLKHENEALRERISGLSSAMLRINASLELDTVLHEIAESARALTGAACSIITTVDDEGRLEDSVFSGFSPAEQRQLKAWPDALQLFEHFRDIPGPLRLKDLSGYIHSLGFPPWILIRQKTFQGTQMLHRGVRVGNFFLGDKAGGGEFTKEDEEVLKLFASQAATTIANARTHRDEQRGASPPGGADRHLSGRRRGLRCQDRKCAVAQP